MCQKQTSSSGCVVREPNFETDPETLVERSLQQEHRDTKFLFYHNDALFSCYLNSDNWPSHFVTDAKLALEPGKRTEMFHRDEKKPKNCIFLGRGPSKNYLGAPEGNLGEIIERSTGSACSATNILGAV